MDTPSAPESSAPASSSDSGMNWLKYVLAGSLLVAAPVAVHCGKELSSASAAKDEVKKLLSVKSFLKENSAKLKQYAGYGPQAMAMQAHSINAILKQLIDELKKAKSAADGIGKTKVRFNPIMFEELEISLDIAIRKLGGGKIGRLNQQASKMHKSRNGFGIFNRGVRNKGINPDAVMYMAHLVYQLKKILGELKTSVIALEENGIDGCSNNPFVNYAISDKLGKNHCATSNTPFCKGVKLIEVVGEPKVDNLSAVQIVAVQRRLMAHDLLGKYGDDGVFGAGSKAAYSKGLQSATFMPEVKACSEH